MNDEPEIIPPSHSLSRSEREGRGSLVAEPLRNPTGVLNSSLTGWQAERRAKALRNLAEAERTLTDYIRARGELAEAFVETSRSIAKLNDLDDVLENDARIRALERRARLAEAERAALNAEYGREATERFKPVNFDIGMARKKATKAEYVDLLPEEQAGRPASSADQSEIERQTNMYLAGLRLQTENRANGVERPDLDQALELIAAELRAKGGAI